MKKKMKKWIQENKNQLIVTGVFAGGLGIYIAAVHYTNKHYIVIPKEEYLRLSNSENFILSPNNDHCLIWSALPDGNIQLKIADSVTKDGYAWKLSFDKAKDIMLSIGRCLDEAANQNAK